MNVNECKTPYGCLTLIFYQKYFFDKIDIRLFYFDKVNCFNWNSHKMQSTENSSSDFDFKCMKANIKFFLRGEIFDYKENKQKRNHALLVILFMFFKKFLTWNKRTLINYPRHRSTINDFNVKKINLSNCHSNIKGDYNNPCIFPIVIAI